MGIDNEFHDECLIIRMALPCPLHFHYSQAPISLQITRQSHKAQSLKLYTVPSGLEHDIDALYTTPGH
jgi:hypothetical protein